MANSRFVIKKNKTGTGTIKIIFNFGKQTKIEYYTPYRLLDYKNWDKQNNQIKIGKDEPEDINNNNKLRLLKTEADKIVSQHINDGVELTKELIKSRMESVIKRKEVSEKSIKAKEKPQNFLKYFEWYLDFYKTNPRPKTNKPYNAGTLRTLRNTKELLEKFQKNKKSFTFDDIDLTFHANLLNFMTKQNYSVNYKGTIIKNIKSVMNDAFERDYHTNLNFKKSTFSKPTEEVDKIYLTEEEIKAIKEADLNKILEAPLGKYFNKSESKPTYEYLDRCRDFFCIGCYTGLRVSDLLSLEKKNIEEFTTGGKRTKAIAVRTRKTSNRVEIPISSNLQGILDKYDDSFPEKVVDSRINLYIKLIAKSVAINEAIETYEIVNGTKHKTYSLKYELISNHTARRSFCTNAYKNGVPSSNIMQISGHKTEKAFLIYIKASARDNFEKIANHPFFS